MDSWCLPWLLLSKTLLVVSGMPTPENFDVDGGKDEDIFDINDASGLNLFEGDIDLGRTDRNAIRDNNRRWPHVIPYVLQDNLEMNAKGVILRAFERYRLKTCIDFKPWEGEKEYISLYKGEGCFSAIGNNHVGKQLLSIGSKCDRIGSIQHEFLHALGFVHEQSRSDRDDYITVMKDRILPGKDANFFCFNDMQIDTLNVPYDYISLTHYSKQAFQKSTEPTILPKEPKFLDMIGQRIDLSDYDIEKLSRLYNCSSSKTFMDSCDFELENICGMIQSSEDNGDWQRVSQVSGGPDTDHSYLGKCKGCGFFMHFNSSSMSVGEKAILESRIFYPKRGFQCLQFYYYNSGNEDDKLNIYVREYMSDYENDSLILIHEIKDHPIGTWQLHCIPLTVTTKFRVVFEGTRGIGISSGGLSIDDINLSETRCPHQIWKISNFTELLALRKIILSPPFYSPTGYAFQIKLDLYNLTRIGIFFSLISGANDEKLQWPCPWHQATMTLLDQNPDIRRRMSNERSITTDPFQKIDAKTFFWDKPSKVGKKHIFPNGTSYSKSVGKGTSHYITHKWLHSRDFIKGDNIYILLTVEDISNLLSTESSFIPTKIPDSTSKPNISLCANFTCENDGVCVIRNDKAECRCKSGKNWWHMGEKCEIQASTLDAIFIEVLITAAVFVIMLVVTLVSLSWTKKKYRGKNNANKSNFTLKHNVSS
ncbi:meprin A subunit beta-like isoform X2 [Sminthopsis crassicaudata]|uniref:meprin A subunit beta-like isoform X2 n=2 Tax=Sminthopsis crassicaudata TaxID=9301 RepID=UPI003D6913F3